MNLFWPGTLPSLPQFPFQPPRPTPSSTSTSFTSSFNRTGAMSPLRTSTCPTPLATMTAPTDSTKKTYPWPASPASTTAISATQTSIALTAARPLTFARWITLLPDVPPFRAIMTMEWTIAPLLLAIRLAILAVGEIPPIVWAVMWTEFSVMAAACFVRWL